MQYTTTSQKSRELHERLFGDKKRARVEYWMADDQRRANANITMAKFSRDRCDRFDSGKPCQEVFEDPVQFAEDPSWSMITLKGIDKLQKYPRTSQARESLMPLLAEWKAALHGTSPRCLFSILKGGMGDSLVDELGCTTTQGMEGVYCFPLRRSDGKAECNKSVGYCSLVPLNNIGALFQAMIDLMVGYADQAENGAQMQTDQRCIPARSCKVQGFLFKATPLEMLERGSQWHHEAWNPMFEMAQLAKRGGHVWRQENLSLRRPRLHHMPLLRRVWFFRTLSALTKYHQQERPLYPP